MPLDQFDDRPTARKPNNGARPGLRRQAANVLTALLSDVFHFRWAFAGLGAVM